MSVTNFIVKSLVRCGGNAANTWKDRMHGSYNICKDLSSIAIIAILGFFKIRFKMWSSQLCIFEDQNQNTIIANVLKKDGWIKDAITLIVRKPWNNMGKRSSIIHQKLHKLAHIRHLMSTNQLIAKQNFSRFTKKTQFYTWNQFFAHNFLTKRVRAF